MSLTPSFWISLALFGKEVQKLIRQLRSVLLPGTGVQRRSGLRLAGMEMDTLFPDEMKTSMKTTKSLQLFGILTITAALAVQVQAQSFLTNGLVAYYPFNGNANDESGNGHDGTPTTNATLTLDRFGFTNCAYAFDGVSAVITIPDSSSLDFAPTAPITVSLWAYRTTGSPVARHLMGKRAECELPANYQLAVNDGNGEGLMFGSGRAADGLGAVDTGVTLPTNVWKHLTGTFDGTAFRFYMNGTLIGTGSGSLSPTVSAPLLIGGSGSCGAANFGGLIDDVRIYNRALSSDEVAQLYASRIPANHQHPKSSLSHVQQSLDWFKLPSPSLVGFDQLDKSRFRVHRYNQLLA